MNIYLIGFMASGKSTIGKYLAHQLSYSFVDIDALIEEKAQSSIPQIFQTKGETYFRQLEQNCLHDTLLSKETVIATGGGTPCFFDNIKWMNQHGLTIYLQASPKLLASRLIQQKGNRPLVSQFEDYGTLLSFIEKKLAQRASFYQQAQLITVNKKKNVLEMVQQIIANLSNS